jgi:hypothetical protein
LYIYIKQKTPKQPQMKGGSERNRRETVSFDERKRECDKILSQKPDLIPIYLEKHPKATITETLKKK